jgi:hypothetical protein
MDPSDEEGPMGEHDEQDPRPTEPPAQPTNPPRPHPEENLARYGAPAPPPPLPPDHPYSAFPHSATPPTPPRRRGPRALAVGTALAVVTAAAGAGFALGRLDHQGQTSAGGPAGAAGQAPNGENFGGENFGQVPRGEGGDPFGGTPFTGPGGSGSPYDSSSGGTPASDSQLTGLVRVASTLKYEGGRAAGTGMILTSTGEVVTNHHVVQGSTKLRVTVMSTGKSYRATVVGTDAKDDIAVLQLQNASGLQTVTTDTDGVSVGDAVTAVGDAGGDTSTFSAAAG